MTGTFGTKFVEAIQALNGGAGAEYSRSIEVCDDAWRDAEAARKTGMVTLWADAIIEFRSAYAKKIAAFWRMKAAA